MPTLDDAPIVPKLTAETIANDDLIQVYDTSTRTVKTITLAELAQAVGAQL